MNLTQVDDLQMLHVQAAKEIRTFRNSVKHADRYKEMAADLPVNTYALNQERVYREQAQECAERYQEIQLQIITLIGMFEIIHPEGLTRKVLKRMKSEIV